MKKIMRRIICLIVVFSLFFTFSEAEKGDMSHEYSGKPSSLFDTDKYYSYNINAKTWTVNRTITFDKFFSFGVRVEGDEISNDVLIKLFAKDLEKKQKPSMIEFIIDDVFSASVQFKYSQNYDEPDSSSVSLGRNGKKLLETLAECKGFTVQLTFPDGYKSVLGAINDEDSRAYYKSEIVPFFKKIFDYELFDLNPVRIDAGYVSSINSTLASPISDFVYLTRNGEAAIRGYLGSEETLIIPETIDSCLVTTITKEAFKGNNNIKKVVLPDSITTIQDGAFQDCKALCEINIPNNVSIIPRSCFSDCTSLSKIVLPEGISEIGNCAFSNCVALTSVVFPDKMIPALEIGYAAFENCGLSGVLVLDVADLTLGAPFRGCDFSHVILKTKHLNLYVRDQSVYYDTGCFDCNGLVLYISPEANVTGSVVLISKKISDLTVFAPDDGSLFQKQDLSTAKNIMIYARPGSKAFDIASELWFPTNSEQYDEKAGALLRLNASNQDSVSIDVNDEKVLGQNAEQEVKDVIDEEVSGQDAEQAVKSAVESKNASWVCPACGTENTTNFCGNCGEKKPVVETTMMTSQSETDSESHDQPLVSSVDEFTLHSGVKFGMTRDEVIKIEEAKGFTTSDWPTVYLYYDDEGNYTGWKTYALLVMGSMAGMPDSQLYYYFDEDDKLFSAVYRFGEHDIKAYDEIKSLLDEKYSSMKADTDYIIASNIDYFYNEEVVDAKISRLSSFQIELEDGSRISVKHILMYPGVLGYDEETSLLFGGHHYLEYRLSTIDELEAVNGAIERKQQLEEEVERLKEKEYERQRNEDI